MYHLILSCLLMEKTNNETHKYTKIQQGLDASTRDIDKEKSQLAIIQEKSQLPEKDQARYQHLLRKCESKTISLEELAEYQTLSNQLETRNLKRIEAP